MISVTARSFLVRTMLAVVALGAAAELAAAQEVKVRPLDLKKDLASQMPGWWEANLKSIGGDIVFDLFVERTDPKNPGKLTAQIVQGDETINVPDVTATGNEVRIAFPHYDSEIVARASESLGLTGIWRKRRSRDTWTELPFVARGFSERPFRSGHAIFDPSGRWSIKFSSSADLAVGVFDAAAGQFRGTILSTTGDYRYLAGTVAGTPFTFGCFDGAHAFLFSARWVDGTIEGDFWSGSSWHETWTAKRDENAKLADPFELTKANVGVKLSDLKFPDVDGKLHSLDEEGLAGHARILQVFGTWCPNCNDEVSYLVDLDRRFHDKGLRIVGLAFELTGDFPHDAHQVDVFAKKYEVRYPLLVAGTSDKDVASKALPLIDRLRGYPTTIFVKKDGTVRAVHQGYSGPATGKDYDRLRDEFERLIDELLADEVKK